jgi:hypothetical protein
MDALGSASWPSRISRATVAAAPQRGGAAANAGGADPDQGLGAQRTQRTQRGGGLADGRLQALAATDVDGHVGH